MAEAAGRVKKNLLPRPDAAVVLLDDAAAEGEAEARAAESARIGCVALLETVEDVLEFFARDSLPLIFDCKADVFFAHGLGAQLDLRVARRELNGVGDEFVEDLQDAVFVGDGYRGNGFDFEGDASFSGGCVGNVGGAAQQVDGFDGHAAQREASFFDFVEVEDVVDEADEAVAVGDGHVDHLLLLLGALVERAGGDQAERRTQ